MATFIRCAKPDGIAVLLNFDYVWQAKTISQNGPDGRLVELTELTVMDPRGVIKTMTVVDPLVSIEEELLLGRGPEHVPEELLSGSGAIPSPTTLQRELRELTKD